MESSSLIVVGATPSTSNSAYWNNGTIPWLPSGCCQDCEVYDTYPKIKYITESGYNSCSTTIMKKNTVLIALTGATAGKVGILKFEACANQSVVGISPYYGINTRFMFLQLMARRNEILADCVGSAQPHISKEYVTKMYFALPPLEEQQRIVEKINLFEPLIQEYDKYEKQLTELESTFVEKLKKSILQYAIEGKLVKQDPNDEPASVLLERIKVEKEKLIKEGKIKRDKNESYIYQGDDKNYYENLLSYYRDFKTPNNWVCNSLINVCDFIHRGKTPIYSDKKEIPVIAQKCNQKNGVLSLNKALFINPATISKYGDDKIIKVNDIIVNSTGGGTVGRVALIPKSLFEKYKIIVTDSHVTTIRLSKFMAQQYVYYYLKSPLIFDHVEQRCEGSTNQMELYSKTIMAYPLPIPPLKEQKRISSKISSLFALIES